MQVLRVLGEGARGTSYLVATPDDVPTSSRSVVATVMYSAAALRGDAPTVSHRLLRHIFGSRNIDGQFVVLSEFVEGGSLAAPLRPVATDAVYGALRDTALALVVWHDSASSSPMGHGGVHGGNVMLTSTGAVLADHRPWLSDDIMPPGPLPVSLYCRAPEVVAGSRPSVASDVWSFGAMVHRVLTGRFVYQEASSVDRLDAVNAALTGEILMHGPLSARMAEVVAGCIDIDPTQRWESMGEVVERLTAIVRRGLV